MKHCACHRLANSGDLASIGVCMFAPIHLLPHHVLKLFWAQVSLLVAEGAILGDSNEVRVGDKNSGREGLLQLQASLVPNNRSNYRSSTIICCSVQTWFMIHCKMSW